MSACLSLLNQNCLLFLPPEVHFKTAIEGEHNMYNGTLGVVHNEYNLGTKCLVFKKASLFQSDLHN